MYPNLSSFRKISIYMVLLDKVNNVMSNQSINSAMKSVTYYCIFYLVSIIVFYNLTSNFAD